MKIQLINKPNNDFKATEQILFNRGCPVEEMRHYLNTTDADINSPLAFGEEALKTAAAAVIKCIQSNQRMLVIVDPDCDGYTSSAIFINYLHDLFPSYVESYVDWFLHTGKQHGLSDVDIEHKYGLVVAPDAGK